MTEHGIHERPLQPAIVIAKATGVSLRRCVLLAILASLMALLPFGPAHAQDLDTAAGQLALSDLDGIQTAVSRTYAADVATLVERMTASPPAGTPDSPLLMLGLIAEFDTAGHAEKAAETIGDRLKKQASGDAGFTVDIEKDPSFGGHAWRFSGNHVTADASLEIEGNIVQQGTRAILTIVVGQDATTGQAARGLTEFILTSRPGTGDVIYDVSGKSQGGIWDMLPGRDSTDSLFGTQPIYDNQIVPPASPDAEG